MPPVTLVLNYSNIATHAFRVLVGALETEPRTRGVAVVFAKGAAALSSAIGDARMNGHKVVVAYSFYSPSFGAMIKAMQRVRDGVSDKNVIHLAGGVHASAEPAQTLQAGFDLVAVGEGERIIIDVIDRLQRGEDTRAVRGIGYLENGEVVRNGRGEVVDLNAFPPFAVGHRRFGPIEITRGCIYGCKFCATPFLNKARFRHRTIENVCRYVRIMKENGLKDYRFVTPTALSYGSADESVNLDAIEELLGRVRAIIGRRRRLYYGTFPSELRPEHVTPEALAILKKYVDNDNLIIGGQSGAEQVLARSRRGHGVEAIVRAVTLCVAAGFKPNVDFLFGLPGETRPDVEASLRLAQHVTELGARVHAHTFMPLPGTPYRHAPPGKIDPDVMQTLDRLTSQRRLYGQWRRQLAIARTLAERRQQSVG